MISSKALLNINENKEEEFYIVLQEWEGCSASSARM